MNDLISLQCEKYCLGGLIKNPEIFSEIETWVKEDTFAQSTHKVIWGVLKQILLKQETPTPVLIAQRITNLNIKTKDDISIFDYLNAISFSQIAAKGTIDSFKELVKLKVLRELVQNSQRVQKFVIDNKGKEIKEIVSGVDSINNEQIINLYKNIDEDVKNIFGDIEQVIEELGNSTHPDSFLYGPLPSVNRVYGSLHRPGNVTVLAARSGVGKSAFSMFYNLWIAEEKNLPLLWLDFGEMTIREVQTRAVTLLTKGKVPVWSLECPGEWRKNPEWTILVRSVWERVKKIKFYFQDVSTFSPQEVISFIRRFSYNKIGRGNPFLVVYDYFKPFDIIDYNKPEWKQMGHFLQDIKSFIVNELPISFWGAIQLNRFGITTNKSSTQIDDSENAIGLSDRITQQSSHAFILRFKTMDELAVENNRFGNMKLINVKARHLGRDFMDAIRPVKKGKKLERNYINLYGGSFYFEDRGDLNHSAKILNEKYDLLDGGEKDETL